MDAVDLLDFLEFAISVEKPTSALASSSSPTAGVDRTPRPHAPTERTDRPHRPHAPTARTDCTFRKTKHTIFNSEQTLKHLNLSVLCFLKGGFIPFSRLVQGNVNSDERASSEGDQLRPQGEAARNE